MTAQVVAREWQKNGNKAGHETSGRPPRYANGVKSVDVGASPTLVVKAQSGP